MEMEEKKAFGRPTKYKDEYAEQAEKLCKLGATDKKLADFFNVCEDTITNWKSENIDFFVSIKRGKDYYDNGRAEDSLINRVLGMEITEERQTIRRMVIDGQDPDSTEGQIIDTTVTKKQIPPDVNAIRYWLNNRNPKRWKNLKHVDHTSDGEKMETQQVIILPSNDRD